MLPRLANTVAAIVALALLVGSANAQTSTWNQTTSGNWSTGTWSGTVPFVGGSNTWSLTFNNGGAYTATDDLAGAFMLNQLNFGQTSNNAFTIAGSSGASLTFDGATPTINWGSTLGQDATLDASLPILLNQDLTINQNRSGSGSLLLKSVISDGGANKGIIKNGPGTVTLNAANTFGGDITINAGTLSLDTNTSSWGTGTSAILVNSSGTLGFRGGVTFGARAVTINGGGSGAGAGAIGAMTSNTNTYGGNATLGSAASIGSTSGGTLVLNGGIDTTASNYALTFMGAGNVTLNNTGAISGGGALTKNGTGTLTLQGTSALNNSIAVNGGVLAFDADARFGAAANAITLQNNRTDGLTTLRMTAGSAVNIARLVSVGSAANTVVAFEASSASGTFGFMGATSGVTGGSSSALLRINSTGIVDLFGNAAAAPVLGNWRLDAGTLAIAADANLGNAANNLLLHGGTLQWKTGASPTNYTTNRTLTSLLANVTGGTTGGMLSVAGANDAWTVSNADQLTGLGGLTKTGAGKLIISAAQNFGGYQTVTLSAGTLNVDADNRLGAAGNSLALNANVTLQFAAGFSSPRNINLSASSTPVIDTQANNVTLAGILSNSANWAKNGSGVLTLSGVNTYTGGTTLTATTGGTLRAGVSSPPGSTLGPFGQGSQVSVNAGTTLDLDGRNVTIGMLDGAGAGTVSLGAGALTLLGNGAKTFAGQITGTGGLTKLGPNDLTLTGDNTFTGTLLVQNPGGTAGVIVGGSAASGKLSGTTNIVVNSGCRLQVGTSTATDNNGLLPRLNSGVNITLGGTGSDLTLGSGSLNMGLSSAAQTNTINSVIIGTGNNTIGQAVAGSGNQILKIDAAAPLVRNVGGTLHVASNGSTGNLVLQLTNPPALANGILGGWAFINSADFATLNVSNQILAYTGYTTVLGTTNNVIVGSSISGIATQTINSLKMNGATATINTGNTLTIATGGILNNNVTSTITGGSITSGTSDLVLYTGTSGGTLTVSSKITGDISLTRTGGGGTVVIGGGDSDAVANDYKGATYSAGAALTLDKADNTVAIPGDLLVSFGTVTLNGSGQIAPTSNVSIRGGTLALGSTGPITLNSLALIQNGNVSSTGGPLITLAGQNAAGNALTLGVTSTYNGTLTVAQNFALTSTSGGGIRFNGLFGAATVSGTLDLGTPTTPFQRVFNVDDGTQIDDLTLSGAISGGNGIEKTGPGRLSLVATTNSFTGGITISGGVLSAASDQQLGGALNSIVLNGGTFRASASIAPLGAGRTITVNNVAGNTIDASSALTLGAVDQLRGAGPLTVVGGNSLTFSGSSNSYSGALSIGNAANFNGTVILGAVGALGNASSITINNGGTFRNDAPAAQTIGSGTALNLNGNATINTNNGSITFNGATTANSGSMLSLAGGNTVIFGGTVTGSGGMNTGTAGGTLAFTQNNAATFSGALYAITSGSNNGTIRADVAGALGTGTIMLGRLTAGGGTLRLEGAAGFTLANNISIVAAGTDTGRSTISAKRLGPGLDSDSSSGVYTVAGNVTGSGGLVVASSTGGTPGEIAFTGNLAWTGSSSLAQNSGGQFIAGGPGSIGTQTAFVRFVDPAKLPTGGANNQVSYHMAMANGNSGGADDFAGFIFQAHASPYTFANAATGGNPAYKFAIGGLNGGGGPKRGVLGAAGAGSSTLAADALVVTDGSDAMGVTLLARDSTVFNLGTPGQAMRFVPATGSVDAANTAVNASASPFVDAAGTRQLIKRGTGTVVVANVGCTNVAGSGNTIGQFSWQIGRGSNPASATTFQFDGAVRETGVGAADSTASLPVYLRGGTLEIDGSVYTSSSAFNRPIHSSTGSPATAGQIDLGGYQHGSGRVDPTNGGTGSDGGGGFAAYNADAYVKLVNVSGQFKIGWSNGTVPIGDGAFRNGAPLILGSRTANATLVLQNDLALGSYASGRTIETVAGTSAASPEGRITGVISGTSATTPLYIIGDGRLDLGAANTYVGQTIVAGGTLLASGSVVADSNGPLGNPAVAQRTILVGNTSGTGNAALLTNGAFSIGRDVTVQAGSSGAATLGGTADANSTFSGTVTLNKAVQLTSAATGGNKVLFSGQIVDGSGSNGLTKIGAGTVELGGDNTYAGGTIVSAGTLSAANPTGSATGTGSVTLDGGTLASGTVGTISGAVAAGSGAHVVAPGGVNGVGTLNLTSTGAALTLNAQSTLNFDLSGDSFDQLLLPAGTLNIASGTPAIVLAATGTHTLSTYTLASYNSSSITPTSFGTLPTLAGYSWDITATYIKLLSSGGPLSPGSGTWKNGATGLAKDMWTTNTADGSNWSGGYPSAAGHVATFDNTVSGGTPGTVDLDGNKTVGKVLLDATTGGYTLGLLNTTNTLTLDNGGSAAEIKTASGTHTIRAKVIGTAAKTLNVSTATTGSLTLTDVENPATAVLALSRTGGALDAGNVANAGSMSIAGTVSAKTISGGGTTNVLDSGSLTANSIAQDTLTIGAGGSVTIREVPAVAGGANAVPEPGTIVLLLTAVGCGLWLFRRRK